MNSGKPFSLEYYLVFALKPKLWIWILTVCVFSVVLSYSVLHIICITTCHFFMFNHFLGTGDGWNGIWPKRYVLKTILTWIKLFVLSIKNIRCDLFGAGGLIFCMEYLLQNLDWLDEHIGDFNDDYLIFDCPGIIIDIAFI